MSVSRVREEVLNVFTLSRTPMSAVTRRQGTLSSRREQRRSHQRRSFSRYFYYLADTNSSRVPESDVLSMLQGRGLGFREIEISVGASVGQIHEIILRTYPPLEGGRGFEIYEPHLELEI